MGTMVSDKLYRRKDIQKSSSNQLVGYSEKDNLLPCDWINLVSQQKSSPSLLEAIPFPPDQKSTG
jgi:hypothetical protein